MKSIRNKLSLATCSLLTTGNAAAEAIENAWEVDGSYLHYSEVDRVTVNKLIGSAKGFVSTKDTASIKVVFDAMSGATPTGAVKNANPLTSTGASGGTGPVGGGTAAPLAEFDDTRVAVSVDWAHEHTRTFNMNYNGAFSVENDWRSVSAAATANKENASRSTKFTFGAAITYDEIWRKGSTTTPEPLSRVEDNLFRGKGERSTTDLIAGITQVINRRTVAQLNLAFGIANGYMTDPYKIFSVVDSNGIEWDQYYEGRPDSRMRWSITANLNHQTFPGNNNIHLSYRYYADDWDIKSHTLNWKHRFNFGKNIQYIEPRVRLYTQSEAEFYQNSFFADPTAGAPNLPQFLSADYRLDEMSSATGGLTYGIPFKHDAELRTRLEYMYQTFKNSEFDTNKAIIFQISYGKRF
ncbi:MAG: DUF3570 domain-containing protein [Thiotrichales bacterium]|nr:MAG: DUF3570 domain-containing protein [Thiotrichales bacterium]